MLYWKIIYTLLLQSNQLDKDIARFTSRELIKYLTQNQVKPILDQFAFYKKVHKDDRAYQFWHEDVHPQWIQNTEMMMQKVEYIHHNPVKRGYVDKAEHWRYSSARNYAGSEGLLEVCFDW